MADDPRKPQLVESIGVGAYTGAPFSRGFPIYPPDRYNQIGQVFNHPVVLVVDPLCSSATDVFAAGFQDHQIGPVLGLSGRTGAGGANVWSDAALFRALNRRDRKPEEELPY